MRKWNWKTDGPRCHFMTEGELKAARRALATEVSLKRERDIISRARAVLGRATPGPLAQLNEGAVVHVAGKTFTIAQCWHDEDIRRGPDNARAIVLSRNAMEALLDVLAAVPRRHNRQVEDAVERAEAVLREELERVGG